jgi:lipoprotein-anchoring transpeptidase ErfK/SrfK
MKWYLRALNVACSLLVTVAITTTGRPALAEHRAPLVTAEDRQIVPFDGRFTPGEIVVSFGDRRLYHVRERGKAISYPIAVPRSQSRWQGVERISMKRISPPWTPTPDMLRENPRLPPYVPGGHTMNPLGVRGLYLGQTAYRIHGTDAPWTIGQDVSKGCIRMLNEHVIELYDRTSVGDKVTITWESLTRAAADHRQGVGAALNLFQF